MYLITNPQAFLVSRHCIHHAVMKGPLALLGLACDNVAEIYIAISALDLCCAASLLCNTGLSSQQQPFRWLSTLPT